MVADEAQARVAPPAKEATLSTFQFTQPDEFIERRLPRKAWIEIDEAFGRRNFNEPDSYLAWHDLKDHVGTVKARAPAGWVASAVRALAPEGRVLGLVYHSPADAVPIQGSTRSSGHAGSRNSAMIASGCGTSSSRVTTTTWM